MTQTKISGNSKKISTEQKINSFVFSSARNSLSAYSILIDSSYILAPHIARLINALERVERGELRRLMVFMPPRHGKTKQASEIFPSWYLGRNPDKQVISCTYSQGLADDYGRSVRDNMRDDYYGLVFPECRLRSDGASIRRLQTENGGVYYGVGVGGSVTGRGAHLLLIDDAVKGRKEADSETLRRRLKNWYQSVARTRLMPNASIVIIQTRWHEDDLAGYLLREHLHENWEIIEMPALDANGRALWPESFDEKVLESTRKSISEREWNALYMQRPSGDDGDYFKRPWFNRYDELPSDLHFYGASDYAVTDSAGDFTEHGIFGVDSHENIYVVDWWSGQTSPDVWIESQIDLILKHKPLRWLGESGPIRRSIEPFLRKRMLERSGYCHLEWVASIGDKPTRSRAFQARASMGKVFLPNTVWGDDLISQLLRFPAGLNDDKVDVCSLFGMAIDKTIGKISPARHNEAKIGDYDGMFEKHEVETWRTA